MSFIQRGGKKSSMSESVNFSTTYTIRAGTARDGILHQISARCILVCFTQVCRKYFQNLL